MTDTQFYNVMFITGVSQVLALLFCWMACYIQRLGKDLRELLMLLWIISSIFLPYLSTGVNDICRGIMFVCLVWAACTFAKYFGDIRRRRAFYIQLFISYIAALGYLLAVMDR